VKTLTFKVSDEEEKMIRSLAKKERTTLSEYLRRRATGMARSDEPPQRVRCEFTGAMIFGPAPGLAPLTTKAVSEMLADFP
jgi:hypothetical protein